MNHLYLLLFFIILMSCSGSVPEAHQKSDEDNLMEKYQVFAKKRFSSDYETVFNASKTYVICRKKQLSTASSPHPSLSFFIFDLREEKVIFEETLPNGDIEWLDNDRVIVKTVPGTVRVDRYGEETMTGGYVYDISAKRKLPYPQVEKN